MNPWQIKLRSLARKAGVLGMIQQLWPAVSYEDRVHEALRSAVKPGDVVWDVGANIGVYTELFCQWVGEKGSVVAFEPFADSCDRIRERVPECAWLRIENIALSDVDTTGMLQTGIHSVYNHIATGVEAKAEPGMVPVVISRGDTVSKRLGRVPSVLKVDVEGFEGEVMAGMTEVLGSAELRSVLVEVHFRQLEERMQSMVPVQIEKMLRGKGFRTKWVAASHLFATR